MAELDLDECKKRMLERFKIIVKYWVNEGGMSVEEKVRGAVFSVLAELDGESSDLPAFIVAPRPHPDAMQYRKNKGKDWWPETPDVETDLAGNLHHQFAEIYDGTE
jgi:hypothetical protein